ncbi:WYL domain-containing protein [Kitasatospora sp. NPDC001527]|uniref:WYL domain-containing protein n=1 Tax=Kitasatospora sp. NPDC001527 TaxID=3154519 RepID=UPI00332E61BD
MDPEPQSVGELADRLQRPGSVAPVLPLLTLPEVQVAEAVAALAPTTRDVLAGVLGATDGDRARRFDAVLRALADHALVWPVTEKPDGSVRVERVRRHRAKHPVPSPRRPEARRPPQGAPTDLTALATRLLAAPSEALEPDPGDGRPCASDTEEVIARAARNLTFTDVRQLAHAVDTGQPITVEYVAATGNETVRTLSRLELDTPHLRAWCHLRDDERVFTLSRIHGVMPA